jgi:hypothetical protein
MDFYQTLEQIHEKQGILLLKEHVLGGQKLDLFLIFQIVKENGGYEKITSERGWKKIANLFHFPSTCTNSAFVLKQIYQKHLFVYEQMLLGKSTIDEHVQVWKRKYGEDVTDDVKRQRIGSESTQVIHMDQQRQLNSTINPDDDQNQGFCI